MSTDDIDFRPDARLAEAWAEGYAAGKSNAMRRMSDEPNAPTSANPYEQGRTPTDGRMSA